MAACTERDSLLSLQKATSLPEDGVPPEIIRLLPHDNHLDKILVQKAACPVGGRSDLDGAAEIMTKAQPNAVVLEKSSTTKRTSMHRGLQINGRSPEALGFKHFVFCCCFHVFVSLFR